MANCIRCGKPCSDGETMCDECKAWFQAKTGGAPVSGAKQTAGKNTKKAAGGFARKKQTKEIQRSDAEQKTQETDNNASSASQQQEASPSQETYVPSASKKISVSPKIIGIIAAITVVIIIAIIVVVIIASKSRNKDTNPTDYYEDNKPVYQEEVQSEDDQYIESETDIEDVAEDSGSSEEIPDSILKMIDKYEKQTDDYYSDDTYEGTWLGDNLYLRYLGDDLVEVDSMAADWGTEYYYDGGKVYYARNQNDAGEIDQLFYDSGHVIYWIDTDGIGHKENEAQREWSYTIDEAKSFYDEYRDKNSAGLGQTSEYILTNSDSEYISKSDLEGLSEWEVRIARNEIMARHGRKFMDQALQDYFNSCSWYKGTVEPDDFDKNYESYLNAYEKKNAMTIKEFEKEKGYNQ